MIIRLMKRFRRDQSGATAVEYVILVSFLSVVVIGAAASLTNQLYAILGLATNAITH